MRNSLFRFETAEVGLAVKPPKTTKKVVPTFSEEDLKKLLGLPDRKTANGFRDYAIMLLLFDSCLRLSELTGLKIEDININERFLKVTGKGDKQRIVPIGSKCAATLARYIQAFHPRCECSYLFLSRLGRGITGNKIQKMVRGYGRKAGIKGVRLSPHTFRHTGAVQFVRNGGDSFALQKLLGHTSLEMTRHYCSLADTDVREARRKFSPADRLNI